MKILIVDDDSLVRIALKTLVDWEEHGFQLAGEAENGAEGLEMIKKLHPDIVMLDIKMPVMDGIELLRRIRELKNPPKTLVLSSYDDFELVKEALKLGADDYLLKLDNNFDNILSVMERLSGQILESRRQQEQEAQVDHQIHKNINVLRKNFFYNAISKFYSFESDMLQSMDFLDIRLESDYLYCFLIRVEELKNLTESHSDNAPVMNYAVINIAEEIVSGPVHSYCIEWGPGEFCLIAAGNEKDTRLSEEQLRTYGGRLADMLQEYLNLMAFVGVGQGNGGALQAMQKAHHGAEMAVLSRFFRADRRVFLWSDTFVQNKKGIDYPAFNIRDKLFYALDSRDIKKFSSLMDQVASDMQTMDLSREAICNTVLKLYYMLSEYYEQNEIRINDVLNQEQWNYDELIRIESAASAQEKIFSLKNEIIQYLENDSSAGNKSLTMAKKYMQDHFGEEISLSDVANAVNLNPSYLSNLLKKDMGKNYSEYLISLRIEKAKNLIKTTDHKMYEISEMVGYPNTFYFTRLFKRETGMTPGEYKKS